MPEHDPANCVADGARLLHFRIPSQSACWNTGASDARIAMGRALLFNRRAEHLPFLVENSNTEGML
jgi:hypothetical protein